MSKVSVMVEIGSDDMPELPEVFSLLEQEGFERDEEFGIQRMPRAEGENVLISGFVDEDQVEALQNVAGVVQVWADFQMESFGGEAEPSR